MGKRYEYKLLAGSREDNLPSMDDLTQAGEEGWDIAAAERNTAIVQFGDPHAVRFSHILLKREAEQDGQDEAGGKDKGGKRAQ